MILSKAPYTYPIDRKIVLMTSIIKNEHSLARVIYYLKKLISRLTIRCNSGDSTRFLQAKNISDEK